MSHWNGARKGLGLTQNLIQYTGLVSYGQTNTANWVNAFHWRGSVMIPSTGAALGHQLMRVEVAHAKTLIVLWHGHRICDIHNNLRTIMLIKISRTKWVEKLVKTEPSLRCQTIEIFEYGLFL